MTLIRKLVISFVTAGIVLTSASSSAMPFVPEDFYATTFWSHTISHFNSSGSLVDSFDLPPSVGDVRGITFGPNGLLYAVGSVIGSGFAVVGFDNSGSIQDSYFRPQGIWGNIGFGNITFDTSGHFYVSAENDLIKFTVGDPNGSVIYTNNKVYDSTLLPNGNLLVVGAYDLREITPNGSVVRTIDGTALTDARGVAYDPINNDIFLTMHGNSSSGYDRLMRLDGTTGEIEVNQTFNGVNDLYLGTGGRLIVGSSTQGPGIFGENLNQIGTLGTQAQMFVTQMPIPVPEPTFPIVVGLGLFALIRRRRVLKVDSAQ